jgi:voltage-gated potassium channel
VKAASHSRRIILSDEALVALRCAGALSLVIAMGTLGFMLIEEHWGVWKSLFFTLITITTVGYSDQNLSSQGEIFAAVLLLFGIGTATYSLTSFVQLAVSYQSAWKKKMQKNINKLQNHFLICGYGRMAEAICEELQEASIPFVAIDSNLQRIDVAIERGYLAIQGNSSEDQILEQAGVHRARGVICAIGSDAENVFAILCVREMNQKAFIASRASTESASRRMERAGANMVVSPYTTAGLNIADAILRPKLSEYLRNNRSKECYLELMEFTIMENSPMEGNKLIEVGKYFSNVVFVAIKRPGQPPNVRPGGDEIFQSGDIVTIAGNPDELEQVYLRAESDQSGQEGQGNVDASSVPLIRISHGQNSLVENNYSDSVDAPTPSSPVTAGSPRSDV